MIHSYWLRRLAVFTFYSLTQCIWAMPILTSPHSFSTFNSLSPRNAVVENRNGEIIVVDSGTLQSIPQGPASDGSGSSFSIAAIIWIVSAFLNGLPLSFAGIRGSRLTTGAALGLMVLVCGWASTINTIGLPEISDTTLTLIVLGMYMAGFVLGLFNFARIAGIIALGLIGGAAAGIRLVILNPNLLIPVYRVNWVLVVLPAVACIPLIFFKQRLGVLLCTTSSGTFLIGLGIDLVVNKQDGMSRGLRFLFDRNSTHLADLFSNGYHPPTSTIVISVASLGAIPIAACVQHRIFPGAFGASGRKENEEEFNPSISREISARSLVSRFSE